ncbi:MAG: CHC2 zinc finger domain-containing protein [Actinomycetota bacterium]|nr:CHC2 zinc finger domain-containing protein [Actinomycetota bacterium]
MAHSVAQAAARRTGEIARPERRGVSNRSVIEEAKSKVAAVALADLLCGPGGLRRVGGEWAGRCPFPDHEDRSPSFTVNPEKNVFFCHGCLVGGDVVELARHAWGYSKDEVATAAAMLLMEFGHEVPPRPPAWFAREERQAPIRDAIEEARVEVLMRRLWRWVFEPILADLEDADERERMGDRLWATVRPLAARLVEDREAGGSA